MQWKQQQQQHLFLNHVTNQQRHINKYIYWCAFVGLLHDINLLNPTGHVMHQQFNIQQLYVLPTLYLFVSYLSENKQRLVPLTS